MSKIGLLKLRIDGERGAQSGNRWRSSKALRDEVRNAASELVTQGVPVLEIASALGIGDWTLRRWMKQESAVDNGGFRRVEVADSPTAHRRAASLVTPAGYRVEGLDLGQLVQLLSALG